MMDLIERCIPPLRDHMSQLVAELRRPDRNRADKVVHLAQRLVWKCRLQEQVRVGRQVIYELCTPPRVLRGLRDLVVRTAHRGDVAALSAVDGDPPELIRQRFDRGDLCFVGQLDGRLLCHAWFHPGPQPFEEDRGLFADWQLAPGTYWSYDAAANAESRTSGIFVKVFQTALGSLFRDHGAQRVQCAVRHMNDGGLLLHERLGFRRLGYVTAVALPWLKWVRWDGPTATQQWLVPLGGALRLPMPPVPPPVTLGLA